MLQPFACRYLGAAESHESHGGYCLKIFMDYAPDGSLLQNLQTGHGWTCLQLLQLASQVAAALQHMHGLRPAIAHLDVKP